MNMVSTVDGKVTLGHSAAGIGSRTDALVMRQLRASVDAVMHGAGTLRAELVDPRVDHPRVLQRVARGLTPQPLAVAVSGSLDLNPSLRYFVNGPAGTVILTAAAAPGSRRERLARYATVIAEGESEIDLSAALIRLRREHGVRTLLSEGGPSLNQRLLDAGSIDEVFWTVAPKLAGGSGPTLIQGDVVAMSVRAQLALVSLFEHDGELFARYRVERSGNAQK